MGSFLGEIATLLLSDHGTDLADVTVVLPSQRAGLYLRGELARQAGKALWSPRTTTLNGLCEGIGGMRTGNTTDLLFEAFEAYRTNEGERAGQLSEFLQWAPTALRDMSEVDAHLVGLDGFYRDLRQWEELDWSFRETNLSRGQERMLRYWSMKGDLHRTLDARWREKGHGTSGLAERTAAERIAAGAAVPRKVWAAGLNALNPAQLAVLKGLQQQGRLELAWDSDRHYLTDTAQEAGNSLREAIVQLGAGRIPPGESLRRTERQVTVVHVPNPVGQVVFAAAQLHGLPGPERSRTAVVLADEQLLMPLLEALPPLDDAVNVTMGMPLHALPVGALLEAVIELHASHRPGSGYTLSALEVVLGHPFIAHGAHAAVVQGTLTALREDRRPVVPVTRLAALLDTLPPEMRTHASGLLGHPAINGPQLGDRLLHAFAWARLSAHSDPFAQEQLFLAAKAQQRLDALIERHLPGTDIHTYRSLHGRILREERLGLFGEPLAGAQVMGILETRALDPHRIVLLSAQEGTLPPSSSDKSFIPHELRRHHGMPSRHDQDAVSAYHFMRLIQRCPDVTLVLSASDETGASRFIRQLELELAPCSATRITHRHLQAAIPARTDPTIAVEKDEWVRSRLRERAQKGLSPSALSAFLRCPLDHYFSSLLGIREREVALDMIAPDQLGNAIHDALEAAYRPLVGSSFTEADLARAGDLANTELDRRLEATIGKAAMQHGQPLLQITMARQALHAFLRAERERVANGADVELLGVEQDHRVLLPGSNERFGHDVFLMGRVDRVERRDGVPMILDLKTGSVKADRLKLKELSLTSLRPDKDHYAFQLLTYAYIYLLANPGEAKVKAGLLPLQRASEAEGVFLVVEGSDHISRDQLPVIGALLSGVVQDLFDPAVPFMHRIESEYCRCCIP